MPVSESRNLGQMRYAYHLPPAGDKRQFLSHFLGCDAPYSGIDFIEHHRIDSTDTNQYGFQGQSQAAQFTAGCHSSQGLQRFPCIGGKQEFHLVFAFYGKIRFFRKSNLQFTVRHGKVMNVSLHVPAELFRILFSQSRQGLCFGSQFCRYCCQFLLCIGNAVVQILQLFLLLFSLSQISQHRFFTAAVFTLQPVQKIQSLLHFCHPVWIKILVFHIVLKLAAGVVCGNPCSVYPFIHSL